MSRLAQNVLGRFGAALQYTDFRNLWIANAFGQAGAWGLIVTRGILIYDETESSLLVGTATFAAMAPLFFIPPIVGVLADRMDRRTILAWTYGVNTVQNLAMLFLAVSGLLEVWMIVVFSGLNGVARAAQLPTAQAMSASLVPRENLLNALSLQASTQHGSRLIGPGIVTPLVAAFGASAGFLACAIFYVIGWWKVSQVSRRQPAASLERQSFVENFVGGLSYVYVRPVLRFMMVLALIHCGLTMAFESLLPTFSHEKLTGDASGFGTLLMGVGVGAFFASLFVGGIQTSMARGNVMIAAGIMSGLGQVVLSFTSVLWLATFAAALMGAAQAGFMTMSQAVTQSIAADEFRGRVASLNTLGLGGIMATMNLLNGSLADHFGATALLFWEGLFFAAIVLLSLLAVTGRRVYGRAPALEASAA
ncbi:MAG TPA: MFS transporter [Dehalococcoidia bacterium]|nr:MFS transporter [Dehalococcoidia bacterium]